jgi:hypothetical protein
MKKLLLTILTFLSIYMVSAQVSKDSLEIATTLEEIITVCNSVLPDGESKDALIFERLSAYILYTGSDAARSNKAGCDYNKVEDRKLVDNIGLNLKKWLDLISEYKIFKYQVIKKNNLDFHTITVAYQPLKTGKNKVFEFLKIKDKFLLVKFE